ncbi:MAG: hypothetical protein IPN69_09245 [Acidobacteria bacterium]|nr:hypothetical protein [Acidobacteriota bacterium]
MKLILDSSEKCRNLISDVLNAAEREDNPIVSTNLVDVFWAVALQSDGVFERQFSDRGAQTMGDIFSRTAVIELGVRNLDLPFKDVTKGARARYKRDQELLRALDAIGESIHQAGALTYNDRDLAIAYAKVKNIDRPNYGWKTQQDVLNWSMWFHSNFERDCNTQNVKR